MWQSGGRCVEAHVTVFGGRRVLTQHGWSGISPASQVAAGTKERPGGWPVCTWVGLACVTVISWGLYKVINSSNPELSFTVMSM